MQRGRRCWGEFRVRSGLFFRGSGAWGLAHNVLCVILAHRIKPGQVNDFLVSPRAVVFLLLFACFPVFRLSVGFFLLFCGVRMKFMWRVLLETESQRTRTRVRLRRPDFELCNKFLSVHAESGAVRSRSDLQIEDWRVFPARWPLNKAVRTRNGQQRADRSRPLPNRSYFLPLFILFLASVLTAAFLFLFSRDFPGYLGVI